MQEERVRNAGDEVASDIGEEDERDDRVGDVISVLHRW
jgi:hypothetical protein